MVTQLVGSPTNIVVATCRNPDKALTLQNLRSRNPGRLHILPLEVTDPESIDRCVKAVEVVLGDRGLDYLLNNAGVVSKDMALTVSQGILSTEVL